jgi:hypothetical protein
MCPVPEKFESAWDADPGAFSVKKEEKKRFCPSLYI